VVVVALVAAVVVARMWVFQPEWWVYQPGRWVPLSWPALWRRRQSEQQCQTGS
jgi:hypothetical protein|tara:strand:- start:3780 stop:3938 length:159 start_codon:yes stop_codon:yes gene_type:complete